MAQSFKFVHAADVHLDTPYVRRDDSLRTRLQEAGREAFARLVDLAIREKVHALLIAGDLFDNDWLTIATERLLTEELRRAVDAGVTVVYATGNHDPGRANYRAMQIDWPKSGFHLVSMRRPVEIALEHAGEMVGWVVAAGHQTPHETENLAAAFPPAPSPEPAVALLHAHVAATLHAPEHEAYAPAALNDFSDKGYVYWALGHIHARQTVGDDPPAVYPGNLQGRHFHETGAKGALLVSVPADGEPRVEFRALAPIRWEELVLDDLAGCVGITDIRRLASAAFDGSRGDAHVLPDQEWLLRVTLRGPCPIATQLRDDENRADLAEYLRDELGVLDVEVRAAGLHPPINPEDYRGQTHLLGLALDVLDQIKEDDQLLDRVTPSELADPGDDAPDPRAYLRSLLPRLSVEAAEALLREPPEVRIDGWEIQAFGPLRGWSVEDVGAHEVVVILGDNETGKSSLFEFFTTALFGFTPATAESHPYTPLEGGFPGGQPVRNACRRIERANRPPPDQPPRGLARRGRRPHQHCEPSGRLGREPDAPDVHQYPRAHAGRGTRIRGGGLGGGAGADPRRHLLRLPAARARGRRALARKGQSLLAPEPPGQAPGP